jgi:threonine/homoserine/homoserine lactone efflux protein
MTAPPFATPLFAAFLLASLLLAITPGPGVLFVVARTLAQGRAAGLASVAGVALGNLANALAACIGLAALFAVSSLAFTLVKYAGAAYLVYLGLQALRPSRHSPASTLPAAVPRRRLFRDGVVVALLNPKTTLFFAAFLPQFISPGGSPLLQSAALGAVFVAIAAVTDSLYVLAASLVAPRLQRGRGSSAAGRWATALLFIGLGLFTAVSGQRQR